MCCCVCGVVYGVVLFCVALYVFSVCVCVCVCVCACVCVCVCGVVFSKEVVMTSSTLHHSHIR